MSFAFGAAGGLQPSPAINTPVWPRHGPAQSASASNVPGGDTRNVAMSDAANSELLERGCTACGTVLITGQEVDPEVQCIGNERLHPLLFLPICMACLALYGDGNFTCSETDGKELFCRWCGDGGNVLSCDDCVRGFCEGCINRNFGPGSAERITTLGRWRCYACEPSTLDLVRARQGRALPIKVVSRSGDSEPDSEDSEDDGLRHGTGVF